MADNQYKQLKFTGDEIDAKLTLISGDSSSAQINSNKINTNNGTLATEDYVNDSIEAIPSATESNDGLMTKELVEKLNSIAFITSTTDPGEGNQIDPCTLYFVV